MNNGPVVAVENDSAVGYARAVQGLAKAATGTIMGVYGVSKSDSGFGVVGESNNTSGTGIGVVGHSNAISGIGVFGYADTGAVIPIVAKGAGGQAVDLQQWVDYTGNVLASVRPRGAITTRNVLGFSSVQLGPSPVGVYISAPASQTMGLFTSALERVRINASGNVGVGTTSPYSRLTVTSDSSTVGTTGITVQIPGIGIRRIIVGAVNSAGTGYRTLKIAN